MPYNLVYNENIGGKVHFLFQWSQYQVNTTLEKNINNNDLNIKNKKDSFIHLDLIILKCFNLRPIGHLIFLV